MTTRCFWILRCGDRLLMTAEPDRTLSFLLAGEPAVDAFEAALRVGEWRGLPCFAADVAEFPAIAEGEALSLRAVFQLAGDDAFVLAGRAVQLLDWQAQHRFCGRCGTPTGRQGDEYAVVCPACGLVAYPRLSPAVMVLVRDGDRLLLARSPRFKPGVFSALAGFVEPGETLEACARREVREEVGVEIANLRYFGSQPWPFPNSVMVAFFADYAGGTITPQLEEIEAADWFPLDALPILPDSISIARRLIDAARREGGR